MHKKERKQESRKVSKQVKKQERQQLASHLVQEHGYSLAKDCKVPEAELGVYFAEATLSNREIARATGWNENTIGKHRKRWLSQQVATKPEQAIEVASTVEQGVSLELEEQAAMQAKLQRMYAKHVELCALEQDVEEKRKHNNLVKEEIKAAFLAELHNNVVPMRYFQARELDFIEKLLNG